MTPPQPWQARARIARQTGDAMLCRLGLYGTRDRKEGTRHPVAADPTAESFRGIAPVERLAQPAEAANGRPGTAGTEHRTTP